MRSSTGHPWTYAQRLDNGGMTQKGGCVTPHHINTATFY
jgi:hypothetical protein